LLRLGSRRDNPRALVGREEVARLAEIVVRGGVREKFKILQER